MTQDQLPSVFRSTLSILTVISVLAIIGFTIFKIDIPQTTWAILSSIISAYLGSHIPSGVQVTSSSQPTADANTTTDSIIQG